MAQPVIQTSFHAGEWAPALNARVDLAKYHAGAALLRNFFVDYRGGASSAPGTRYVIQARVSTEPVRLIPFQASFTVSYVLEFGEQYIRFIADGAPILEGTNSITNITNVGGEAGITVANSYSVGDWVFIQNVGGATQLNGKYFIVHAADPTAIRISNLRGTPITFASLSAYTSGGTTARVFTLPSPYVGDDLAELKFAQNVNTLVLCHPDYVPHILTFTSDLVWSLTPITFGSNVGTPGGVAAVTSAAGAMNYSYVVTALDANNQESGASSVVSSTVTNAAGNQTITVSWNAVSGAQSYNVYRTPASAAGVVPTGSSFGFINNVTGVSVADTFTQGQPMITADFSESIPIAKNPFQGAGVASVTITNPGAYTSVPTVTFGAAPAGGVTATGNAFLEVIGTPTVGNDSENRSVGDVFTFPNGVVLIVASVDGLGQITAWQPVTFPGSSPGAITSGSTPTNPVVSTTGGALDVSANFTWGIGGVNIINAGAGYTSAPGVTFSGGGGGAATAVLQTASAGNPTVPSYFQQRLVLAAPPQAVQTFYMSQPGSYFNFNITDPRQADDAITGSIVSQQLNTIKSMIPMPSGLVLFGDRQAWLVNGGGSAEPITPINASAQAQAYNGANDVPPIVVNYDIIYIQAKGSYVRDLTYNFYTNIYTGTDISILSSHLFYGFQILEWAYAEEPFKIIWAVRNDGDLLSLTFLKEQELVGWAHRDTEGLFKSVASITETVQISNSLLMNVDAVYVVVSRVIDGTTYQYIERMAERIFPYGREDAWSVDSGLQSAPVTTFLNSLLSGITLTVSQAGVGAGATLTASSALWSGASIGQAVRMGGGVMTITNVVGGPVTTATVTITQAITDVDDDGDPLPAPPGTWTVWNRTTSFSGGEHLAGLEVTGVADGAVIPPFTMASNGNFTLASAASKVTVGLAFTPQLQTLMLDTGDPTIQGKRKKITGVTVRCQETLGLTIGGDEDSLVVMKDLVVNNVNEPLNEVVVNLVTGDARTNIDPRWTVEGQYFIEQPNPWPATILGVIPELTIGDTPK